MSRPTRMANRFLHLIFTILCAYGREVLQADPFADPIQCLLIFTTSACVPIVITKCSILFFYRRIFRGTAFSIVNWTTLGLVVAWMIAFFFAILFSCTPIGKSLENYPHPVVKCIDQDTLFYVGAGSDIAIDFIILFIPWPFIWKLQMSTKNKIAVTSIFFLGIL